MNLYLLAFLTGILFAAGVGLAWRGLYTRAVRRCDLHDLQRVRTTADLPNDMRTRAA